MALLQGGLATDAMNIVPSDTLVYSPPLMGLYVGGKGGDVTLVTYCGRTTLFSSVQAGTTLQVIVRKVLKTGTTATSLAAYQ